MGNGSEHPLGRAAAVLFLLSALHAVCAQTGASEGWRDASEPARASSALERAWSLACAIPDDKDQAKAQERVALARLESDDPGAAEAGAAGIEGWRRGSVLAAVAVWHAEHGNAREARRLADDTARLADGLQDWQRDRVQLQTAHARAMLGDLDLARDSRALYATNDACLGRAEAAYAVGLAHEGRMDEAREVLTGAGPRAGIETAAQRSGGFLLVADRAADPAQASNLIEQAWQSLTNVPGYLRVELQLKVVDAWNDRGARPRARQLLAEISSRVEQGTLSGHILTPLKAAVALRWAQSGAVTNALSLVQAIEPLVGPAGGLQTIEQPAVWAALGEVRQAAGDAAGARAAFHRAIDTAASLANARPRALAGVDVSLALHRSGIGNEEVVQSLDRLLASFHAPQTP